MPENNSNNTELDRYILHLNHALSMEAALVDHLGKRAEAMPIAAARERIRQHREETIRHRDSVKQCIAAVSGEPTATKATVQPPIVPNLLGKVMTLLESEKEDRLITDALADYAIENYEDALYAGLRLIAHNLGYAQHASLFEEIRQEERAMAKFLAEHEPDLVQQAFPPTAKAA